MPIFTTSYNYEYVKFLSKEGVYFWEILDAKDAFSKNGDEQIILNLVVGDEKEKTRFREYLTFSIKGYFFVELFLKSAGIYPGVGVELNIKAKDLIGLKGLCETVNVEKDHGESEYTRVKSWLRADKQKPIEELGKFIKKAIAPVEEIPEVKNKLFKDLNDGYKSPYDPDEEIPF